MKKDAAQAPATETAAVTLEAISVFRKESQNDGRENKVPNVPNEKAFLYLKAPPSTEKNGHKKNKTTGIKTAAKNTASLSALSERSCAASVFPVMPLLRLPDSSKRLYRETNKKASSVSHSAKAAPCFKSSELRTERYTATSSVVPPADPNSSTIIKLKKQYKKTSVAEEAIAGASWYSVTERNTFHSDAPRRRAASASSGRRRCHTSLHKRMTSGKL